MRKIVLLASIMSFAIGAPALAQDAMGSHDAMAAQGKMGAKITKVSPAMQRKMAACNAMSHDAMVKDAGCAKLMKAHPDMMGQNAMSQDSMMSSPH